MPTYAQLRSESVWNQEVVTPELDWLVDSLCSHFKVPRGNGGEKGDNRHMSGGHRSQAWIKRSRFCTNRGYSVEAGLPAHLENDIAAFDVTLPHASMLDISRRADEATRAGRLEELVEWFGNVNGDQRVDGWNNIENRVATSDSSHLWHFHGRMRRSLTRDRGAMERVFAALTGQQKERYTVADSQLIANAERAVTAMVAGTPMIKFDYPWPGVPAGGFPNPLRQMAEKLDTLIAAAAADETRDKAFAAALEAAGGTIDAAPIIATVREVGNQVHAKVTELQQQLAAAQDRNDRLTAALAAAGASLEAADDPADASQ